MAGAAGPDKTWCGFLLISFHHSRGFAASGNQSLSFVGRFMTARCIFVVEGGTCGVWLRMAYMAPGTVCRIAMGVG